jgi:succinoglycan biosynthesis transport protein ExoP
MRYEMRFRDVLDVLRRRRAFIARTFAVCAALGLAASFDMRPVYRASALITSDKTPPVVVLDQPGYAGPGGPPPVGVDGLDVPTLVALVKSDATRARARQILARTLGPRRANEALKGLRAQPLWDTQLVRVSVEHANPQVAAAAANAVAAALIDVDARSRRQWATGLRRSIQRQLAESDPKLRAAEDALVAFRSQHDQVPLSGQTDQATNELAQLDTQRVEVGLQQQEVRARIDAARSRLAQQARISPTEWRPSPLISTLQTQLATEEIELSGLQRQFTPKHPALLNVEAKIDETKRRLDAELANSLQIDQYGVDPTYQQLMQQLRQDEVGDAALTARDQALQAAIAEAEGRMESLPAAEVAQARLARDAKEAEEIHQILTEKLQQAMVAEISIDSVVRIVDGAVPPDGPVRPRWLGVLFGAVLGGVVRPRRGARSRARQRPDQVGGARTAPRERARARCGPAPHRRPRPPGKRRHRGAASGDELTMVVPPRPGTPGGGADAAGRAVARGIRRVVQVPGRWQIHCALGCTYQHMCLPAKRRQA